MSQTLGSHETVGAIALEHLTGPSRGTLTWLNGPELMVSLSHNRILRIAPPNDDDPSPDQIARLEHSDDSYKVTALGEHAIWVNGNQVTSHRLEDRDMVEFGEVGPLSRFCLYQENWQVRTMLGDILRDGIVYLRVSRKPWGVRLLRAMSALIRRLTRETTMLFRFGVMAAIVLLGLFAYQQTRLNVLLQTQIDSSSARMDDFAGTLRRTREEALTPGDLEALQQELARQLSSNVERLETLELRSEANARVIAQSLPSIVFVQGAYGYRERSSGRMMRHVVDQLGRPMISPMGHPLLALDGEGPVAERQFTGTAFAVGMQGALVTNRHVALPWEKDANIAALNDEGLEPVMIKHVVYAPNRPNAYRVELVQASEEADLAILQIVDREEVIQGLKLANSPPVPGSEIIVMGYPTGLRSMLAQSGGDFIEELQETGDVNFWSVARRLAEGGFISPLSSRGIISQASATTVVYDAETTHGGSGGPVLDTSGRVVAVNAAILPEYGGSNLGVPVEKARNLLSDAGLL